MNFEDLNNPNSIASLTLTHYQKIGKFRREHVSVGAGKHTKLQDSPYTFKREYNQNGVNDKALVYTGNDNDFVGALDVFGMWSDGTELQDYFSGSLAMVSNGTVTFGTTFGLVLIGEPTSRILSVDEINFPNAVFVKAWPNPFTNSLQISFSETNISNNSVGIEMYDIMGKKVFGNKNISLQENSIGIDTPNLTNGMYLMKIQLNGRTQVVQLIKK